MGFSNAFTAVRSFPTSPYTAHACGYGLAVGIALWLTWGIWSEGPPVGGDTVAHLIRAEFAIDRFVLNARLDGWQPSFALGYQQHLFIGPVLTWLIALIQALSLGTLSTLAAFKVAIVLLFAALPLAAAYLARSFGLSREASSVAAVLSLVVNSPFGGFGLNGLFDVGLTVALAGAVALCLALGAMLRLMREPSMSRALLAGALFALLVATHGISAILAVALLSVLWVLMSLDARMRFRISRSRWRRVLPGVDSYCDSPDADAPAPSPKPPPLGRWLVFSAAVAFAVSAWIVIPILAHYELRGVLTGWGHTPLAQRLADIWGGQVLFQRHVAFWVAAGLTYGLWRVACARYLALSLVAAPFALLGLGELMTAFAPGNVISLQIPNRGLGLAGLLAVFPLAAFATTITRPAGKFSHFLALAIVAIFVALTVDKYRPAVRSVTPTPVGLAAAAELRRRVPDGARYAMQRDFPDEIRVVGMMHPDFWMAWQSGRNTLNVFNVESSSTPIPAFTPESLSNQPAEQVADKLSRYGVTHVLLVNQAKATGLLASTRFNLVWQSAPLAILAVLPRHGQPNPASLLATECPSQAALTSPDPEHLRISVETAIACRATIAVAWSPKWVARLNEQPVRLGRTEEGLLTLPLASGRHTIAIDFEQDPWDRLGIAVSILACLAVPVYGWRRRIASSPDWLEKALNGGQPLAEAHWPAARKKEIVLRLLRGEQADALAREFPLPKSEIEQWRKRALAAIEAEFTKTGYDPVAEQLDAANRRIGELVSEIKLLRREKRAKRPSGERKLPR